MHWGRECILLNENFRILNTISLKYIAEVLVDSMPASVQTIALNRRQTIIWTNDV